MSVIQDLKDARDIVANGWCSRGPVDADGNLCTVMALNQVTGVGWDCQVVTPSEVWTRRDEALDELRKHLPSGFHEVAYYNDDPETTHQDVLNLFDKALADLGGLG